MIRNGTDGQLDQPGRALSEVLFSCKREKEERRWQSYSGQRPKEKYAAFTR